ncbi:carbohydrate ABC transporter permease [Blautia liquoris]|uniref:Carbohydrate ABC transporter permease n=1 Tax=Blautia liquoris TaxID=2779518 RepID=A0A7M2RER7_9FIRM|nr:carbohydrate ABC transporter permease [Blautia liquoris]QOV18739.1 carbohydrate ABC transporter permease [Blautia liquoris]
MNSIKKTGWILIHTLLLIYALLIILPIVWMVFSSFKDNISYLTDPWGMPKVWHFENYLKAWDKGVQNFLVNSIFVSAITLFFVLLFSTMFSFMAARFPFKGASTIVFLFFAGNMIPIHCVLIPLFSTANKVGLVNSLWSLIIPYIAFNLPMAVFLTYGHFQQLPNELQEAATIDGCNTNQMFRYIFAPLAKPALVTVLILTLVSVWNEFSFALIFINDAEKQTIPLGLMTLKGTYQTDYAALTAALTMASLPIILIYIFMSKKIQAGLTAGAVKG